MKSAFSSSNGRPVGCLLYTSASSVPLAAFTRTRPSGVANTAPVTRLPSWSTDYGFGFDFTPYFVLNVRLYLRELEGLAASITYLEQLNRCV